MSASTSPTPGTTTPGTFLGREPLLWANAVRAVLLLLIGLGVLDLDQVQIALTLAANEALLYLITRTQATPNVSVVERTAFGGDVIVAGPANERVDPGTVVRRVGDEPGVLATLTTAYAEPVEPQTHVVKIEVAPAAVVETVAPDNSTAYLEPFPGMRRFPQTDEDENG